MGVNALTLALAAQHSQIVERLLEAGANIHLLPKKSSKNFLTPYITAQKFHPTMVPLLERHTKLRGDALIRQEEEEGAQREEKRRLIEEERRKKRHEGSASIGALLEEDSAGESLEPEWQVTKRFLQLYGLRHSESAKPEASGGAAAKTQKVRKFDANQITTTANIANWFTQPEVNLARPNYADIQFDIQQFIDRHRFAAIIDAHTRQWCHFDLQGEGNMEIRRAIARVKVFQGRRSYEAFLEYFVNKVEDELVLFHRYLVGARKYNHLLSKFSASIDVQPTANPEPLEGVIAHDGSFLVRQEEGFAEVWDPKSETTFIIYPALK